MVRRVDVPLGKVSDTTLTVGDPNKFRDGHIGVHHVDRGWKKEV